MTVHLHDYGQVGLGAGGAPINYAEVSRLIRASQELAPERHDFHAMVADSAAPLRTVIRAGDTLVCTAGPYAHIYHYWREKLGLNFRIIRDARTTAWIPYLAQEWLVAPLRRDGDALIVPSQFARLFYQQMFPHLGHEEVHVLYPMAHHLPAARATSTRDAGPLRIGCLGRISDDKNTAEAFELVRQLSATRPTELHLAGAFQPRGHSLPDAAAVPRLAHRLGLPATAVIYHGDLRYEAIWRFLGVLDVLYFPAVSSNESFGRVLLEAGRAGVPVVATDFAAAPELVPDCNLVPVSYRRVHQATLSSPLSLGTPDTAAAARIILAGPPARDYSAAPRYAAQSFLDLVGSGRRADAESYAPGASVQRFLSSITLRGVPPLDRPTAMHLCERYVALMRALHHPRFTGRLGPLTRLLRHLPDDPILQQVFRERLRGRASIGVLRNAVALGCLLGFSPLLSLDPGEA